MVAVTRCPDTVQQIYVVYHWPLLRLVVKSERMDRLVYCFKQMEVY